MKCVRHFPVYTTVDPTWKEPDEPKKRDPADWEPTQLDVAERELMEESMPQAAFRNITLDDLKNSTKWDRMWNAYLNTKGVAIDKRKAKDCPRVREQLKKMADMADSLC